LVLRWAWRVGFYGYSALGTDRYPPFSFSAPADYPATLDVPYPAQLSRGLPLVGSWLRGLPQFIIISVPGGSTLVAAHFGGLITVLALVAGVLVLVTASYPPGLFDSVMGLNRWVFRVVAFALLMCPEYPPFRGACGLHGNACFSEGQGRSASGAVSRVPASDDGRLVDRAPSVDRPGEAYELRVRPRERRRRGRALPGDGARLSGRRIVVPDLLGDQLSVVGSAGHGGQIRLGTAAGGESVLAALPGEDRPRS
jgi:Domain of unknown function (DUF4389)